MTDTLKDEIIALTMEAVEKAYQMGLTAGAKAEREACAKVAEQELSNTASLTSMPPKSSAAWNILQSLRARGQA